MAPTTIERNILNEFFGEGGDMGVTIHNLKQLTLAEARDPGWVSTKTLVDVQIALKALNNLSDIME